MAVLLTFLEGLLSFLSPCLLPLLPVYLSFFAGNAERGASKLPRTLSFVLGFTVTFLVLGLLSSSLGQWLSQYRMALRLVCGAAMILFGLNILGVVHLPAFWRQSGKQQINGVFSAFLFGLVYPVNLMPCIGVYLGSALALAVSSADMGKGIGLLLAYSAGLGIPFVLSALLVSQLDQVFRKVKGHYGVIQRASGCLLILAGLLTALGVMERWMGVLA